MNSTTTSRIDRTAGERLFRSAEAGGFSDDTREFRAVIATAYPVQRRDAKGPYLEILDPAGLIRSGDDLPLLLDHRATARETVGRAHSVTVDGATVLATLRLAAADDVEPLAQRLRDGTLRHVSAGYQALEWTESVHPETRQRVKTAARWRLLEVSLTPIPADPNAVIMRSEALAFDTIEARDEFVSQIRSLAGLPDTWGDDLPEDATEDAIRAAAREAMTQRTAPRIRVTRSHDDPVTTRARQADALAFRMGGISELPEASREFAHLTLMDHAREALTRSGTSTRGLSPDEVLQRALTTSDFPLTVANAANKTAADGYQAAASALKPLFRQRSLNDFKTATSVRLGGMGQLAEMTESGEFTAVSRGEEGETLQLRTFGRRLDLSRRLIVNDDLGLFGDTTRALGEAAAQTEAALMAELVTGDDKLSDGKSLFHATRANAVSYTPQGSSVTRGDAYLAMLEALAEARKILRTQKGLDGETFIAARPKFIVAGPEAETLIGNLLDWDPSYASTLDVLTWRKELTPLIDPRISGHDVYLLADPASVPVFNQATFGAAPGPQIQRQESWDTLGVSFRVWLDTGVGFAGWRGAVKIAAS